MLLHADDSAQSSIRKIQSARNNAGSPTKSASSRITNQKSLDLLLGTDRHPFVKDGFPENQEIFCHGNFSLTHLNVGCKIWFYQRVIDLTNNYIDKLIYIVDNKLTGSSANALLDVLRYQKAVPRTGTDQRGLKYILLEGNDITDSVLNQIREIIDASSSRRSSSILQESLRKKKTSTSSYGAMSSKNIQNNT